MDFGALPPEINSTRIYSGPGSAPMLSAASAWDQLSRELNSAAAAYRSVIVGLMTDGWRGPSSTMMADALAPYLAWMHNTAAAAEQTSVQATTAAAAYQSAFAQMVPPPLIEANRTQMMALVASNFFGQNSPAIATTEADYDAMWAQDASAMYGYQASSSSTASGLTPFTDPPPTTNPAGVGAATHAAASPAQAATQLPTAMQAPTPPTPPVFDAATVISLGTGALSATSAAASVSSSSFSGTAIATTNRAIAINAERDEAQGMGPFLAGAPGPVASVGSLTGAPAAAAMGRASMVGTLSVPQGWTATVTLPTAAAGVAAPTPAAPPPATVLPGQGVFGEALLGTLAGRGVSNLAAKMRRPSVIPRSPSAG
jgi:PPE-repeat protein